MTDATTTMTTISRAASIVDMAFLFPSIFFNFFTPFWFLNELVPRSTPEGVGSKLGPSEKERLLICSVLPLSSGGGS